MHQIHALAWSRVQYLCKAVVQKIKKWPGSPPKSVLENMAVLALPAGRHVSQRQLPPVACIANGHKSTRADKPGIPGLSRRCPNSTLSS